MTFEDPDLVVVEGNSVQVCISVGGLLPGESLELGIVTTFSNFGKNMRPLMQAMIVD